MEYETSVEKVIATISVQALEQYKKDELEAKIRAHDIIEKKPIPNEIVKGLDKAMEKIKAKYPEAFNESKIKNPFDNEVELIDQRLNYDHETQVAKLNRYRFNLYIEELFDEYQQFIEIKDNSTSQMDNMIKKQILFLLSNNIESLVANNLLLNIEQEIREGLITCTIHYRQVI